MRRREECGGGVEKNEMNNLSKPLAPTISMNNVYSQREKDFIRDYYSLQMHPAGQSPNAVSREYPNIPTNRQKYLKNIVKEQFKK